MNKSRKLYLVLGIALLSIGILSVVAVMSRDKYFFKKTNTGLAYKVKKRGEGLKPAAGQILLVEMQYQTDKKVLFTSESIGLPMIVPYDEVADKTDGGIYEAMAMLQKGDRYIFLLPAKSLLGAQFETLAAQHQLKEDTPLYLHLYLKDITTEEGMKTIEADYLKTMIQKRKEQDAQQIIKDVVVIDAYLKKHQLQASVTPSELRYIIHTPGEGANPQPGNTVKVNYVGKTLEGVVFDTNMPEEAKKHNLHDPRRSYDPLTFTIGEGGMIPGFEEGVRLLSKGGKATLLLPSVLAYRDMDLSPHIKPHTSLVFEVEVVDIQTKDNKKTSKN